MYISVTFLRSPFFFVAWFFVRFLFPLFVSFVFVHVFFFFAFVLVVSGECGSRYIHTTRYECPEVVVGDGCSACMRYIRRSNRRGSGVETGEENMACTYHGGP